MMGTCSIDGCDRTHMARGWCGYHYQRWFRHGDPETTINQPRGLPLEEGFRWNIRGEPPADGSCWEWPGRRRKDGYGLLANKGRTVHAHHASLMVFKSMEVPDGMEVLHTCDNPPCVNPEHLLVGTHEENMKDSAKKGRQAGGSRNGRAMLTEADVLEMRVRRGNGESVSSLALEFGVRDSTASVAIRGITWRGI